MVEASHILSGFGEPDIDRLRRRVFAILNEAKLDTRADRLDLASFVLGRRVKSFTEFGHADWVRIADACSGWFSICELRRQKGLPPA